MESGGRGHGRTVSASPGSGTLKIDFVGELNDKMKGFYRSKYSTPAGEPRYAAVTQFEVSGSAPEERAAKGRGLAAAASRGSCGR